jgi:acyl carrier protein
MLNKNDIHAIILKALNDVNEERNPDERVTVTLDVSLYGSDAVLDSLSLVSFIVDVESAISEKLGFEISLSDDRAMSQNISPYSNVHSLTAYIQELVLSKS